MSLRPARWRMGLGTVVTCLAAGGLCPNPLAAQSLAPGGQPYPVVHQANAATTTAPDREVTLTADGSFRGVVRTADGRPGAGARLTLVASRKPDAQERVFTTGAQGDVRVSGLEPGLYRLQVEAKQGRYQGTLQVDAVAPAAQPVPDIAVFTLQDVAGAAAGPDSADTPDTVDDLDDGRMRAALILGGIGAAAAGTGIALPLILSKDHNSNGPSNYQNRQRSRRPPRAASP